MSICLIELLLQLALLELVTITGSVYQSLKTMHEPF